MKIYSVNLTQISCIWLLFSACGLVNNVPNPENTILNMSRQGLKEIPDEVFEMKHLKILKLYGNKIDSISPRIGELVNLEKLYIGKNNLTHFPAEIGQLKNLKLLSAQYNEIQYLTGAIGKLDNLEELILNQNRLKTIPVEIGKLKNLKSLQLNFNFMTYLPPELGNCTNLEFLMLNRNMIEKLPVEYGKLIHLKELYLAGAGNLVEIPESFCEFRSLYTLEIDRYTLVPPCMWVHKTNQLRIYVR